MKRPVRLGVVFGGQFDAPLTAPHSLDRRSAVDPKLPLRASSQERQLSKLNGRLQTVVPDFNRLLYEGNPKRELPMNRFIRPSDVLAA